MFQRLIERKMRTGNMPGGGVSRPLIPFFKGRPRIAPGGGTPGGPRIPGRATGAAKPGGGTLQKQKLIEYLVA